MTENLGDQSIKVVHDEVQIPLDELQSICNQISAEATKRVLDDTFIDFLKEIEASLNTNSVGVIERKLIQ